MDGAARHPQRDSADGNEAGELLGQLLGFQNEIITHAVQSPFTDGIDITSAAGRASKKLDGAPVAGLWGSEKTVSGRATSNPSSTASFPPLLGNGKVLLRDLDSFSTPVLMGLPGGQALRLLVIEDDPDLNRQLAAALTDAGYVVDRAFDGEEGHYLGESEPYDAVILDIGLPKMDGISVLEAWRRAGRAMPVLMLTARDRWSDKVQGFDAGADDYVPKPFHLEEVLARIRALLRRSAGHAKSELNCGPVRLDTRTGRVSVDGNPVKLTSHEYRLLSYLMHHTGRVVSRSELVEHLYDQDFDRDSNTIEVFVGRIRRKLGVDVIQTVRGLGYLLNPPGNAS
jgi:two-component system OmpR family response regulator